jgi:hypothetical protein
MTIFKILNYTEEGYDCECCGYSYPEGTSIFVDEIEIWEKYTDGHLHGNMTEAPIVDCLLTAWYASRLASIEAEYTEEKRHDWNRQYVGNSIARTPESWLGDKLNMISCLDEYLLEVKSNCTNLPYDEVLQVKMIALWIQSACGETIEVLVEEEHHNDEY